MNDDGVREMLEGGRTAPAGHVADIPEGMGPFSFGSPWSGIAKLVEEMGELQTIIGKLMATGGHAAHWQGDLIPRLEEESGDVRAALLHVVRFTVLDTDRVLARTKVKMDLFEKWHHEGKRNRDEADLVWGGGDP